MNFKIGDYVVRIKEWNGHEVGFIFKIKGIIKAELMNDIQTFHISDGDRNHDSRNLRMATSEEAVLCDIGLKNINDTIEKHGL